MGKKLLFRHGDEWSEQVINNTMDAMAEIAMKDLGLDIFRNDIRILPESGMLDAYAFQGMPAMYPHWSFGKRWKELRHHVRNGITGLAFEMIIPTDPCISWNMASNNMATTATVLAHAAFGHNHVFKNNYLFQKHTHYQTLADYCFNTRDLFLSFEKMYGEEAVEETLDSIHALVIPGGVFRDKEPEPFNLEREKKRLAEHMQAVEQGINLQMLATVPGLAKKLTEVPPLPEEEPNLPEENILYFLERYSPRLKTWQREMVRAVRTIAQQTTYPIVQTRVLHEGAAMFVEMYLEQKLYEQGRFDEGTMVEFAKLNQSVLYQEEFRKLEKRNQPITLGNLSFNPYALGLAICKEIVRISGPRGDDEKFFAPWVRGSYGSEDRKWFSWAGDGAWRERLKDAWANYRDDSFIEQFLSPRLMREWQLFAVTNNEDEYVVSETVHERTVKTTGYEEIRTHLAKQHSYDGMFPQVAVTEADLLDDRELVITYSPLEGMPLDEDDADSTIEHIENLWGYSVTLKRDDE